MTTLNKLYELTKSLSPKPSNNIEGHWFNILLKPDIFNYDQFSIGVGFVDNTNILHAKFTDDLSRLRCFYENNIDINELSFLIELLTNEYDRVNFDTIQNLKISPQISFSKLSYASGENVNSILDNLYTRTIHLKAFEDKKKNKERFQGISDNQLRDDIFNWVSNYDAKLAKRIFPNNICHKILFTSDDGVQQEHYVELPIHSSSVSGSIVSAYCKNPNMAKLRILQAAIDINTAKIHYPYNKYGLFILRADEDSGLPISTLNQLDDMIDENVWKLKNAEVYIGSEQTVEKLSEEIITWAA